jgi:parvulin-like peptidyl-prolyl isomerase
MNQNSMHKILVIILSLSIWTLAKAQEIVPPLPADTLAKVGTTIITARDLIERIELMPWPEKEKPREHDSSKVKALNSIIAERMLAMEGKQFNVGSDELTQLKMRAMEKLFVRDELFKRKVKDKVKLSEEEIRDGLAKFAWELHLVAIGVKNQLAGDSLYRMLRRNPSVALTLKKYPADFVTVVETVKVNFGGLDTSFEKEVYAIGKKKFSKPFVSQSYGWVVAVLLERTSNPVYEKMTWGDRRYRVDETIRRKKETAAANQYYNSILIPRKAKSDSAVFKTFALGLRTLMLRDSTAHKRSGLFAVISEDVDELLTIFAPELIKNFIEMEDKAMTFGEVIEAFRSERFGFPSLDVRRFESSLNSFVRTVVQSELVAREGFRQNLQHSEHVRHDLGLWSGYWVSRYFMWILNDTVRVDEEELVRTMMENLQVIGDVYRVNVQEVLCDSMTTVERVFESLANGISLDSLATKYSKRQTWAAAGGVSGYFPLSQYPELGCRAMLADTALLIGPVKLSEGYSIFKVIGKKRISAGEYPEVDSLRINIKANLTARKRQQSMNIYLANLAKQYSVEIYYRNLSAVEIQPANMFTRRIIGFGGVITAAPMLYPNWEWVKEWREMGKILP